MTNMENRRKRLPRNDSHTHIVSKDMFGMLQLYCVCMDQWCIHDVLYRL